MAMVISTNTASINAQRHLNASRQDLDVAMERLSSGQRINSAADDAAGLAIRDKMTSQVEGLNQAVRNANDAISFMQSAEGALEETTNILQRMRTLAVQAVNDTNSASDRANLNDEIGKLQEEITRIGNTSTFNNKNLIDGSMTSSVFQVGHISGQTIEVSLNDMRSTALGSSTYAAGATYDQQTVTLSGSLTDGETVTLDLTWADTTINTIDPAALTVTAGSTDITGASALATLATAATESYGDSFTFTVDNNVLTITSKTAGVDGRFTASAALTGQTAQTATVATTTAGTSATPEVQTITLTGGVNKGDSINVVFGGESFTYTATADRTQTEAATAVAALIDGGTGSSTATTGVITATSTTALANIASAVVSYYTSASSSVTETVDGAEAVAVAQKTSLGISGSLGTAGTLALENGKTIQLVLTANGPDKVSGGSDNVVTTISHTAAADMTGAEVAAALATKISSAYTLSSEGNNLIVTTNTGGDAGAFTVALKDDAAITGTYASSLGALAETKNQTTAKDGAAAATDTTISKIAVTDGTKAAAAISVIDNALKTVGQERAKLGAFQNRLTHAVNNMTNMSANTASAKSVIADADYAAESSSLAKNQILQQAGTAMLAQANAQAQSVLSLLK